MSPLITATPEDSKAIVIPSTGRSLSDGLTPPLGICDELKLTVSYERPEGCRLVQSQERRRSLASPGNPRQSLKSVRTSGSTR